MKKYFPAIVSDIDGVLLRGTNPIKNVQNSIKHLYNQQIPFILMTNGGGKTEQYKTQFLNYHLFKDENILKHQDLIQCHTPFIELNHYKNEYVLLGGNGDIIDIAQNYGYKKAIHISELHQLCPWLYGIGREKIPQIKEKLLERFQMTEEQLQNDIQFKAAMVWSDVDQFEITLQLFSDALISHDGKIANYDFAMSSQQNTNLYFSNNDLIYPHIINIPRQAGGVFKLALEAVFERQYKIQLKHEIYGKPNIKQFQYAEKLISQYNKNVKNVYMIGDNINSDIEGVNNMKKIINKQYNWISILVKTGIYKEGYNNNSDYVVDDFNQAVDLIFNIEKIQKQ